MPSNGPAPNGPKPPASPAPPPPKYRDPDDPRLTESARKMYADPRMTDPRTDEPERSGETGLDFWWGVIVTAVLIALVILTSRG